MVKTLKQTLHKGRYTNNQLVHENVSNAIRHQGNAN